MSIQCKNAAGGGGQEAEGRAGTEGQAPVGGEAREVMRASFRKAKGRWWAGVSRQRVGGMARVNAVNSRSASPCLYARRGVAVTLVHPVALESAARSVRTVAVTCHTRGVRHARATGRESAVAPLLPVSCQEGKAGRNGTTCGPRQYGRRALEAVGAPEREYARGILVVAATISRMSARQILP